MPPSLTHTSADALAATGVPAGWLGELHSIQPIAYAVLLLASVAGLGLTLIKAFAELHGGTLELDSRAREGFRATVTLPPAPAAAA